MEFSGIQKIFLNIFCGIITGVGTIVLSLYALLWGAIGFCIIGILSIVWFNIWQSRGHDKIKEPRSKESKIPKRLPEGQENILKLLATLLHNERLNTDEIAGRLCVSPQKTQSDLDELEKFELVVSAYSSVYGNTYCLSKEGRNYLNKKGIL